MKLASLKHGRDGKLVLVSDDLAWYAEAGHIAPTLQTALDDWGRVLPDLQNLATDLEHGTIPRERFHEHDAAAPLPRAYQWATGSAYVNHLALLRQAQGADMPERFWRDPLMHRGGSDGFLGPREAIALADEDWGCDLEAEVVVVTGDVPPGASRAEALDAILLVGLANDISLRTLIPEDGDTGADFFQSRPASAFSPVFVTPDALGRWWRDGKLHRKLLVDLNGAPLGRADAGENMVFDFGTLVAHAAKTRKLGAGTIIGSGAVSNGEKDGGPGKPVAGSGAESGAESGVGYSCLVEQRAIETIQSGAPITGFLKAGDTVRIWAEDDHHHPIFGVIEQTVLTLGGE